MAATGKLQGVTLAPEAPQVFPQLRDALDYKPSFQVIALFAPIGLMDSPVAGGRACDHVARALLGWPRSGAIASAPTRRALACDDYQQAREANGGHLSVIGWRQLPRVAEVDAEMAPYWQRSVFEVHPELSFFQLNEDRPMRRSKRTRAGQEERASLLRARLPGIERILDLRPGRTSISHVIDAAACLWTARRIISRAVTRIPEDPIWDSQGLRMEIVR